MTTKALSVFTSALFLATAAISFAAPPDAGQLLREQEPQRQLPQQLPKPSDDVEKPAMADSGVRVVVRSFAFTGYEGLATLEELQALVAGNLGKELSFRDLQAVTAKVTAYLKEHGWFLARAYLPRQDVNGGSIEIAIIHGKSDGTLNIIRDKSVRLREKTLHGIAKSVVSPGQPINEKELERSVLLMNDLPGISARASLAPGATQGTTAVKISASEGPLLAGGIWGDNQGNRYTGTWRGNGMLNINDPFSYGDHISLLLTGAEGLIQGRAGYTFPITPGGLKGSLTYTGMGYQLIGDLASLQGEGQSHSIDAGISYPLIRTRTLNLNATANYGFKALTDSYSNVITSDRQLNSGTIGINGSIYDTALGGGYTTWNASVTTGSMHEGTANIAITGVEGAYSRFNIGASRLQRLAERLSINLSYSGQFSLNNLDSSEKFNLGGPYGVRAYPVGEASGDEGHLFNIDLRYDLPLPASWGSAQVSGFYDAGQITLHHSPWLNSIATATNKNSYWLQGAGIGLNYVFSSRFNVRTSWAHTIGTNDGRSTSGKDSDGRSDANRFWLQGTVWF